MSPGPGPAKLTTEQLFRELATLRDLLEREITHLRELNQEKFRSIAVQFSEREQNTQAKVQRNTDAIDANERLFARQIEQTGTRIDSITKNYDQRFSELKDRMARTEGGTSGVSANRAERRLDIGQIVAVVAVIVAVISVVVLIFKK